ncbi:MAG: SHOCT domain-containing protein [Chloroflexota bacterium]
MVTEKLPKQVSGILAQDEKVESIFDLDTCIVYSTNTRLITQVGRRIQDYHYNHISSVAHESKRHWMVFAFGIVFILLGTVFLVPAGTFRSLGGPSIGLGLILFVVFMLHRPEWVEVHVVGVHNPLKLTGSRKGLDSLLRTIREKRATLSPSASTSTQSPDVSEQIRRLAQLKEEGILTEQEFEQKKAELLKKIGA